MAQNPYNNYIKRKAQTNVGVNPTIAPKPNNNPSVGFKKRVVGNLGGNALTPVTQTQKSQNTSSQTTNQYTTPPEANTSPSNNVQPVNNINTQPTKAKAVVDAPVASQANTVTTEPVATTETVAPMQVDNAPAMYATRSIDELNQINAIADEIIENPMMSRMARSTGKTPQQYAQELFEQQKTQLQKDWELKQQELKLQQEQAQKSWQTSVDDTDKKYNETVDKLNLNRYDQMQDLSVSATNRGLQYSPQQLGLENVANINHNKNLAEASKQRNEMLTQLNTKLMELQAQLTLGSQNAVNEYNKALGQLSADYNSKLMDWSYDKQMTDEERKWQEAQAQKDREWQEKMDKANKEWQSKENALDRKNGRSGSSYGGYGYSSSWNGASGWKNYKGSGWSNYGDYGDGLSLNFDDINQASVYFDEFKNNSTDVYNSPYLRTGGLTDVNERAKVYSELIDPEIKYAEKNGASKEYVNKMIDTRDTAIKHMYERAVQRDKNGLIKLNNDTIVQSKAPLRDSYIAKVKANEELNRAKFYESMAYNDERRKPYTEKKNDPLVQKKNKINNKAVDMVEKIKKQGATKTVNTMKKNETTSKVVKNVAKAKSNTKTSTTNSKNNAKASVKKAVSNTKKATTNSKNNAKTSVKKAVTNTKTSVKKSTANTKKSTNNALKNLKKNISKLFKKKK